jgi:hypothetical protein
MGCNNLDLYPVVTFILSDVATINADEDEELRLALAASLEDTIEHVKETEVSINTEANKSNGLGDGDIEKVKGTSFIRTYPPLPDEPLQADATVCRVAVRFPDGSRGQRRFFRADPIQVDPSHCRLRESCFATRSSRIEEYY